MSQPELLPFRDQSRNRAVDGLNFQRASNVHPSGPRPQKAAPKDAQDQGREPDRLEGPESAEGVSVHAHARLHRKWISG